MSREGRDRLPAAGNGAGIFSPMEEAQLMRLVYQAFDLRESPYYPDALKAITDWRERALPDRIERAARATPEEAGGR